MQHPLDEFARSAQLDNVKAVGDPHYDDPSLALMFQQIKGKSLQTTVGSSEVAGQTEFNFVLHTASVFKRMGKYLLAVLCVPARLCIPFRLSCTSTGACAELGL